MNELKEILLGILVLIYGSIAYILGRTNFIEAVVISKLQGFVNGIKECEREESDEKRI